MASIGEMFAYFKQIKRLDNIDIETARRNIARNARGFNANVAEVERASPILREMK